jgi:hypothetical protein
MLLICAGALSSLPSAGLAQTTVEEWRFSLKPYIWLPGVEGTLNYRPPPAEDSTPDVRLGADTLLGALDAVLMIGAEARKGEWSVAGDLIYLDLSADNSAVRSVDSIPDRGR